MSWPPMKLQRIPARPWNRTVPSNGRRPPAPQRCSALRPQRGYATQPHLELEAIDRKWQTRWQRQAAESAGRRAPDKSKAYILAMFPYPSGALHMGHFRNYAVADVLARFRHMQGHEVLHPMGWDAFGLPAENAAIERGVHPAKWTRENTSRMKAQLQAMNSDMDWSREFMTCDSEFYKHTQRLFLLLHRRGLAYQAEALVNYDPVDKTVLANEQVDANGCSWRSGAKVELVKLRQWFLGITAFREKLLEDLDFLSQDNKWPDRVLAMQRHWLGRSAGATIKFGIKDDLQTYNIEQSLEVFTTRPDTLFGVQYLAVSAAHPLVTARMQQSPDLAAFVGAISSMPADSKAGYQLPGVYGMNPLSSLASVHDTIHRPLPVFVAPYVLDGYGSGAVMGVPGHDARDFAFWSENRPGDAIRYTITLEKNARPDEQPLNEAFTDQGHLSSFCQPYEGMCSKDAMQAITSDLSKSGLATPSDTWRLRDWLISRQRYWGTPIPIIHCEGCGPVPVPDEQLPVQLPDLDGNWFKSRTGNPLAAAKDWVNVPCPKCGVPAKRDTDTMDTFMDSSWYFFRFTDPHNPNELFDAARADHAMPVDVYIGGIEHAILHLMYARFISKFLATTGLWPGGKDAEVRGEPFQKVISQGMVHGKTYSDPESGRFLRPEELDLTNASHPKIIPTGQTPNVSFEKMSKSKYNGVDPSAVIAKYGADVTRAHILFQAPVTEVLEWEEDRIVGVQRWFQRIWRLADRMSSPCAVQAESTQDANVETTNYNSAERALHNAVHNAISSITAALSHTYTLNTCISDLMQLTNQIHDGLTTSKDPEAHIRPALLNEATQNLVLLLAPFAPAFASECWEKLLSNPTPHDNALNKWPNVFDQPFPTTSAQAYLEPETQICAIMENGRKRLVVSIPAMASSLEGAQEQSRIWILEQLHNSPESHAWLEQKEQQWERIIVAKGGKTVNFVGKPRASKD